MSGTVVNTNSNGGVSANAAQALGFTPVAGHPLIFFIGEEGSDTVTGLIDNAGNTYVQDATSPIFGNGRRFFRCQSLVGIPTTFTVQAPTGVGIYWAAWEATGIASSGSLSQSAALSDNNTAHSVSFTTTTANEMAFLGVIYGGGAGTSSSTAPDTLVPHTRYGWDAVYNADKGAAGAKTLVWNTTTGQDAYCLLASYKTAVATPNLTPSDATCLNTDGTVTVNIAISPAAVGGETFNYATADGTATNGVYYTGVSGTKTLTAGQTNATVVIGVVA